MPLLILCLHSNQTLAHYGGNPPIAPIQAGGIGQPENHAGYGYMSTTSEAEAFEAMHFICPDNKNIKMLTNKCDKIPTQLPGESLAAQMAIAMNDGIFQQKFKNKIFEYLAMQSGANSDVRPISLNPPECVTNSQFKNKVPPFNFSQSLTSTPTLTDTEFLAIKASYIPQRMAQSLLLDDQLQLAEELACGLFNSDFNKLRCLSIKENRSRNQLAFPALFQKTDPASSPANEAQNLAVAELRESIFAVVGSNNARPGASIEENKETGRQIYNAIFNTNNTNLINATGNDKAGSYDFKFNEAFRSLPVTDPTIIKFSEKAAALNSTYANSLNTKAQSICNSQTPEILNTTVLANRYPQVLRQLLLDMKTDELPMAKNLLCKIGLVEVLRKNSQEFNCTGISGQLDKGEGVSIQRMNSLYPFGNEINYKVKKNTQNGHFEVTTLINFKFIADTTIPTPIEVQRNSFDLKIQEWKRNVNQYISAQAAGFHPPLDPAIDVKLEVGTGTALPLITVSTCYNSTLPPNLSHQCAATNAPRSNGSPLGNWQDAGGFTLDFSPTGINHEMGHQLGLADEYSREYYPINTLGENDSVMNTGNKMFPRHFKKMILPAINCSSPR
jgi:hypothetical protein